MQRGLRGICRNHRHYLALLFRRVILWRDCCRFILSCNYRRARFSPIAYKQLYTYKLMIGLRDINPPQKHERRKNSQVIFNSKNLKNVYIKSYKYIVNVNDFSKCYFYSISECEELIFTAGNGSTGTHIIHIHTYIHTYLIPTPAV